MRMRSAQFGFSLLELILVIVLLGVLASGAGLLITTPIEAYNDQLRRQQLVDQAEMSLRQIARDVRRALPNSIRFTSVGAGWALEMVNTVDGARYRDEAGTGFTTDADILDFSGNDTDFNFLGNLNNFGVGVLTGLRVVIYNTSSPNFYANVAANSNPGIVTPGGSTLTLSQNGVEQRLNINPGFQFAQQSPGQRAFLVDGPISYICNPATQTLTRYTNYPFQLNQPTTNATLSGLAGVRSGSVATQLAACTIDYNAGTAQRGGIVALSLTLNDATGEAISLLHQIHVANVP